jgi:hypothetical protein
VNTESEDHAADEWRFACMSRPWIKEKPQEEKGENTWSYRRSTKSRMPPIGGCTNWHFPHFSFSAPAYRERIVF